MKDDTELKIEHRKKGKDDEPKEVDILLKGKGQFEAKDSYISSGSMPSPSSVDHSKKKVDAKKEEAKPSVEDTSKDLQTKIKDYPLPTQEIGAMTPPDPPVTKLSDNDLKADDSIENKEGELGN